MQAHLAHLLALAPVQNPSTGIEWFVLSPFLGGSQSAVVKNFERSSSGNGNGNESGKHRRAHRAKHAQTAMISPMKDSAFAHRDLKIVWEVYAKHINESMIGVSEGVDLVKLVKGMAEDLGSPEAVCMCCSIRQRICLMRKLRSSICRSRADSFSISIDDLGIGLS